MLPWGTLEKLVLSQDVWKEPTPSPRLRNKSQEVSRKGVPMGNVRVAATSVLHSRRTDHTESLLACITLVP